MYVGVEYESRFLLKSTLENLKNDITELEKILTSMNYVYFGEYIEEDYYFLPKHQKKTMKYAVNVNGLEGRVIYKEEITNIERGVINLEISEEANGNNIEEVIKAFPYISQNEFDFSNIRSLIQQRKKYVQKYVQNFESINCSVDIIEREGEYYIFIEFETSVSEPKVLKRLKKISKKFKDKTQCNYYVTGKRGMISFEDN